MRADSKVRRRTSNSLDGKQAIDTARTSVFTIIVGELLLSNGRGPQGPDATVEIRLLLAVQ